MPIVLLNNIIIIYRSLLGENGTNLGDDGCALVGQHLHNSHDHASMQCVNNDALQVSKRRKIYFATRIGSASYIINAIRLTSLLSAARSLVVTSGSYVPPLFLLFLGEPFEVAVGEKFGRFAGNLHVPYMAWRSGLAVADDARKRRRLTFRRDLSYDSLSVAPAVLVLILDDKAIQ
ncbi:hypothetical protein ACI65C_007912 [Semiaphis heraclei]